MRSATFLSSVPVTPALPVTRTPTSLFDCPALSGIPLEFPKNAEIFGENDDNNYVYKVVSGLVRTSKFLSDGRRQIGAFYFPGDVFGLESGAHHWSAAEAVTSCQILLIRRTQLDRVAETDNGVARQIIALAMKELQRSQARGLLLVRSATERVAAFLLEMASRIGRQRAIDLPMSRQDIADYLGLTIETVSRTITQLTATDTIKVVATRHIELRNVSALSEMNA